ncbi:hypothetical protein CAPTEDRAFT_188639 [Capitella teleta]|uniref:WSC domain-containing protein n=1 Tax=Capitella teleta TaxID=283909 RepID=R7V660_CAPTE|nr:hypothetical protein CAPTEDRAFT_188639 [Capitella teleta]|eukprot:ELU11831.1 hypothetical protein CAPTEDRAFT_188639 [Capitella teleta]
MESFHECFIVDIGKLSIRVEVHSEILVGKVILGRKPFEMMLLRKSWAAVLNAKKLEKATVSEAEKTCIDLRSHLPDLASAKDGSLESKLTVGQSTWIGSWIERGPWRWHSSEQVAQLHRNQGCHDTLNAEFVQKFTLESTELEQTDCLDLCKKSGHPYTALSMITDNQLGCYCGSAVPLEERPITDAKCSAKCTNGEPFCGVPGFARIITADINEELQWTTSTERNLQEWCAALKYESTSQSSNPSAYLAKARCDEKRDALCVIGTDLTTGKWTAYVDHDEMNWFEAQTFCSDVQIQQKSSTLRLYKDVAEALLGLDAFDNSSEYWTELSSLQLTTGLIIGASAGVVGVIVLVVVICFVCSKLPLLQPMQLLKRIFEGLITTIQFTGPPSTFQSSLILFRMKGRRQNTRRRAQQTLPDPERSPRKKETEKRPTKHPYVVSGSHAVHNDKQGRDNTGLTHDYEGLHGHVYDELKDYECIGKIGPNFNAYETPRN